MADLPVAAEVGADLIRQECPSEMRAELTTEVHAGGRWDRREPCSTDQFVR